MKDLRSKKIAKAEAPPYREEEFLCEKLGSGRSVAESLFLKAFESQS